MKRKNWGQRGKKISKKLQTIAGANWKDMQKGEKKSVDAEKVKFLS